MRGKMNKKTTVLLIAIAILVLAGVCAGIVVMHHQKPVIPVEKPVSEEKDTQSAPTIVLDYNNVTIGLDYSFTVQPKVFYKGEEVKEEIAYTWQLNEETSSDVAKLKQQGNSAVITGLKYGDTAFTVSARYQDTLLVKELNVCVTNVDVMFESSNMEMSAGCYQVNLGLVETEKDITSMVPEIKVYDKEELVENPKFTWSNSDESIAVRDKDGRITAKKAGVTEIVGMYKESKLLIRVNVYRPEITIDPIYIEAAKDYTIRSEKWQNSKVEKVTFAGKDVMKKSQSGSASVRLDKKKLPELGTGGELVIQTEKIRYIADSKVVTMAIYNESNLNQMASVIKSNKGTGYYALANNIKCKGKYDAKLDVEFNGVFDGSGYTIYNMTTADREGYNRGLVGESLGSDGVVKNVSFVNAKHGGQGGFITTKAAGKIENVYIQIKMTDCTVDSYEGATSVLASSTFGVFSTKSVIVEYLSTLPQEATTGYAVWQLHYGYAKHQGLYVIGEEKVAFDENDLKGGLSDDYGAYVNYGEFADAGRDVSTWDDAFWTITNGIPYPVNLGTRKGSVPKVKLPKYVGTGSTVVLDGLTIYDRVIVNGTMNRYGIKVKNGALVIPKNVPSGTKLTITVQSAFDASKKTTVKTTVLTSNKVSISKVCAVELQDSKTFYVDLSSKKKLLSKATLTDVTIDGKTIADAKYKNSSLAIKTAYLGELGARTLQAYFKSGSKLIIVNVCVDACTLAIENEADLNKMASVIQKNKGEGRYVLANNITCKGKYDANINVEFNGVFEGHGYAIYNMTTADREGANRGLLGKALGARGVVKNTSFINAKHSGQGGFIVTEAAGTMENLYVQIAVTGCSVDTYDGATSVLASSTFGVFNTRNVIVEYTRALPNDAKTGYAVWQLYYGYAKHQGLYVIGEEKVAASENDLGGGLKDRYGAYVNYGEFIGANISDKTWDSSFWTVTNKVPYPKRLGKRKVSAPKVSIPKYVGKNSKVKIDGLTICDQVLVNATMKKLGIKVKDGYLIIPKNITSGTTFSVTVQSAFDSSKKTTVKTTVLTSTKVSISKVYTVEVTGSKNFTIDLSGNQSLKGNPVLTDATIDGKAVTGVSYKNGVMTLTRSSLGEIGEKTLQAYFKSGSGIIIVNVPVDACTLAIEDEADLNNMASIIRKNQGEGRYVLANDITCRGTYDAGLSEEFNGVFEGHGYAIYNMATADREGADRGLLGRSLGAKGAVRNVSFVNAKHSGQGGFIVTEAAGTMENLYVQIAVTGCTSGSYEGATSVLASSTFGVFNTRNVIVEYINTLPQGATTGYAVWQLHYGYAKHQGLYVIGEAKVAAQTSNLGGGLKDRYDAFINYGELINANISATSWDSSFWKVTNKVPYPKHLGQRKGTVPNVSIAEYTGQGAKIEIIGLTVCDYAVVDSNAGKLGVKLNKNIVTIPGNIKLGTTIKITVQSAFDSSKKKVLTTKVIDSKKMTLTGIFDVETYNHTTFDIDFGEQAGEVSGGTVISATMDGTAFTDVTYNNGVLSLDTASVNGIGQKSITVLFMKDNTLITVTIHVDVCTFVIRDEADLNRMASAIRANNGAGRYVLANDIACTGTFDSGLDVEFAGTFDGRGHVITNMTTSDREGNNRGLVGASLGATGVVKNVSFVNAKHGGQGGFIATSGAGTIQDVYIRIAVSNVTNDAYDNATSVLASSTYGVFTTNHVLIEYANPLPADAATGYAVWQLHYGYGKHQGLYVIGADKVASQSSDLGGGVKDRYAAYMTYGDFADAKPDLSGWNNDFWTIKNNIPYPTQLTDGAGAVPQVSIPEMIAPGSITAIEGATITDQVVLSAELTELGIKVSNNKLIVPDTVPAGTVIEMTVQSVFDTSKAVKLTTKVFVSKAIVMEDTVGVAVYHAATAKLDLSTIEQEVKEASLLNVTVDGNAFENASYRDNILTIDTATFTEMGEKTVTATFKSDSHLVTVSIPVDVCTMVIKSEEDLNKMPEVITENRGEGRYILGNHIVCKGEYNSKLSNTSIPFIGTFDGRGYAIYNMTITTEEDHTARGLFGAQFGIAQGGSTPIGTIKNVSFLHAKHNGQGGFIASKSNGTIENVYIQIDVTSSNGNQYEWATSVLGSETTPALTTKNVLIEYEQTHTGSTGYALWQQYLGLGRHQGLYVVGASKVGVLQQDLGYGIADTYGAYATYDALLEAVNFESWKNDFWDVDKDGRPSPKKQIRFEALSGTQSVGLGDEEVKVDFSSVKEKLKDTRLSNVSVNGESVTAPSFNDNVLTLDMQLFTETGSAAMLAEFVSEDGNAVMVSKAFRVCTMVIRTEEDLNNMSSVIVENNGKGTYVLGNNIRCTGEYDANISTSFVGTFDGCGYAIYNMRTAEDKATSSANRGFFGFSFGQTIGGSQPSGVMKNVAFVNAKHSGLGGFLASKNEGTLENVYVQITVTPNEGNYSGATSVLGSETTPGTTMKKVLVEYVNPLADSEVTGYPLWQQYAGLTRYEGLYAVGAKKIAPHVDTLPYGQPNECAAYTTYAELTAATSLNWENDFWTMKDGKPSPKILQ